MYLLIKNVFKTTKQFNHSKMRFYNLHLNLKVYFLKIYNILKRIFALSNAVSGNNRCMSGYTARNNYIYSNRKATAKRSSTASPLYAKYFLRIFSQQLYPMNFLLLFFLYQNKNFYMVKILSTFFY